MKLLWSSRSSIFMYLFWIGIDCVCTPNNLYIHTCSLWRGQGVTSCWHLKPIKVTLLTHTWTPTHTFSVLFSHFLRDVELCSSVEACSCVHTDHSRSLVPPTCSAFITPKVINEHTCMHWDDSYFHMTHIYYTQQLASITILLRSTMAQTVT